MKKKWILLLVCICGLFLVPMNAAAQTCSEDFTVKTVSTNSTCLSNGTITVTLEGNTSNLTGIEYGLSSDGFSISPQANNVLQNIPAGSYTLTVRAFCSVDVNFTVIKVINNVVVGGNYQIPQASYNINTSRKSYPGCASGIIAIDVTGGNGTFTFEIVAAPAGVPLGFVTPTRNGNVYTLPGMYPPGDYNILVDDGCYTSSVHIPLDPVSVLPSFSNETQSAFRADMDNTQNSCSFLGIITTISDASLGNADIIRYRANGMYEIGAAPIGGGMPTQWTTLSNLQLQNQLLNISPYKISDFYGTSTTPTIEIYIRVKDCPTAYRSFQTYVKRPIANSIQIFNINCDNELRVVPWSDSDGVFCYPLTLNVTDSVGGLIHKGEYVRGNSNDLIPLGSYEGRITATFTDQSGTAVSDSRIATFSTGQSPIPSCNSYRLFIRTTVQGGKTINCYSYSGILIIKDSDGNEIARETMPPGVAGAAYAYYASTYKMQYGINYLVQYEYPNGSRSAETLINFSGTTYSLNVSIDNGQDAHRCSVDVARFRIEFSYSGVSPRFLPGATVTITGPAGYTTQTLTTGEASSGTDNFWFYTTPPTYPMPPGLYTIAYDDGDCIRTVDFNNPGIYNYENFGYTSEQTCAGLLITPTGNITYQGVDTDTYYQFSAGPAGYSNTVIAPGGTLLMSTPGTYTLGIKTQNTATSCVLGTLQISYNPQPLILDPDITAAYVCVGEYVGNIIISAKALNGVPPFTYSIWDETNTVKQDIPDIVTDGIAHFEFGEVEGTYTIRVSDACGNSFGQQVYVNNLATRRIVYSPGSTTVCIDGTVELKCITLGNTTYSWTGPNGYTSSEQNPTLENLQPDMTGWYKVNVTPEYCGSTVKDSIYVTVLSPLTVSATAIAEYEACSGSAGPEMNGGTVSGGDGSHTYKWQSSPDGVSDWTDIAGATGNPYAPSAQLVQNKVVYYRMIATNICGSAFGDPIHLTIKNCGVPVNPHLMNRTQRE